MIEEATAAAGGRNILVVTRAAAEEVAEFIILAAEPVCRVMLLEAIPRWSCSSRLFRYTFVL
jgi:hypothetical protein